MGATNVGSQVITTKFGDFVDSTRVDDRFFNTHEAGIYKGGYLTRVTDAQVTLSALVCEIADATQKTQVKIDMQAALAVNVTSTNKYVVLRWTYATASANYMDILALPLASIQSGDLIVGMCQYAGSVLTGIDYTSRSNPQIMSLYLKVEATDPASLNIRIRAGKLNNGNLNYSIADQLSLAFVAPVSLPRIDVVYVDIDGTVKVYTGTEASVPIAPLYNGKVVLAEITLSVGATSITQAMIRDVRSFLSSTGVMGNGTVNPNNLLSNGDFSYWSNGFNDMPDHWDEIGNGNGSVVIEYTTIKDGPYSLRIMNNGGGGYGISQQIYQTKGLAYWKGKTVTLSGWVYATQANKVRIGITNGDGNDVWAYHSGSSTWEYLTVSQTVGNGANRLDGVMYTDLGGATSAWFSGMMYVEGGSAFAYSPSLNDKVDGEGTTNPTNLIYNGDFDLWSAGTTVDPDSWGHPANGMTITQEASIVKNGTYSAKLTQGYSDPGYLYQRILNKTNAYLNGRTITFSCWVWANTYNTSAQLSIGDDSSQTFSDGHPGDSRWHLMSVTKTITAYNNGVYVYLYTGHHVGNGPVYFSGAMCVEGKSKFAFSPKPPIISILTGVIRHGATIPLPDGYTQAQCKWMVSVNHIWHGDRDGGNCVHHYVSADANRVVTALTDSDDRNGCTSGYSDGYANYMIIGIK